MIKRIVNMNNHDEWWSDWSNVSKESVSVIRNKGDLDRFREKSISEDLKYGIPPILPDHLIAVAIFTGTKPLGFYPEVLSIDETDKEIIINWAERGEYEKTKTDTTKDKFNTGIETSRSFVFKILNKTDKPISFNKVSGPSMKSKPKGPKV